MRVASQRQLAGNDVILKRNAVYDSGHRVVKVADLVGLHDLSGSCAPGGLDGIERGLEMFADHMQALAVPDVG